MPKLEFKPTLKFDKSELMDLEKNYINATKKSVMDTEKSIILMKDNVQQRGHLTEDEFRIIADWKSPRPRKYIQKNDKSCIVDLTRFSLKTTCERARIEALQILDGVAWPMASAILHLFHQDNYPILDYHALNSLSIEIPKNPTYHFDFWWNYVLFCRDLAIDIGVSMRTLDRALWQYDKENSAQAKT